MIEEALDKKAIEDLDIAEECDLPPGRKAITAK